MIVHCLQLALRQLTDPRFRSTLIKALLMTALVLIAAVVGLGWLVSLIGVVTLPFVGAIDLGAGLGWVVGLGGLILSSFLMVPVAAVVIGFFLEDIAQAVEDVHFPAAGPAKRVGTLSALGDSVRFLGVVIGANLAALILYLLFPPFAPFIFVLMNGYLLGREYFSLVALRRMTPANVRAKARRHRRTIWGLGALVAIPLAIPLFGLLVPLVGVAAFTHLFHQLNEQPG